MIEICCADFTCKYEMCAIINTAGQFNIISPHKIILTDKIDKTTLKTCIRKIV